MRPFLEELLRCSGAEVEGTPASLRVLLPEEGEGGELARRLGRRELELVFDAADLRPGADLVAPGGHVLRAVEELLAPLGRRAYVVQPGEARLTLKTIAAAGLQAGRGRRVELDARRKAEGYELYVVYRLRYRSLQRVDELQTVRVRLLPPAAPVVDLAEPPEAVTGWETRPRKAAPEALLTAGLAAADAAVAEVARRVGLERREQARRGFAKDVSRLHAYYSGQISELLRKRRSDLAPLRIEELEEERDLRLRELAQATEVSVEVDPLQLLTIEVPLLAADLVVRPRRQGEGHDPASDPRAPIALDRATGALSLAPCPGCGEGLRGPIDGCQAGRHVVHEACLGHCDHCGQTICGACESAACEVCDQLLCPACGVSCEGCARRVCAPHVAPCAVCQRPGCAECLLPCASCGAAACARDRVEAPGGVLCGRCAVTCPGCQRAVAAAGLSRCGTCGRRFCGECYPEDADACALCR